ncbi:MAG: ribosome biogenesis GTPase Der [Patescibacteria group bacterium]|nr:ribosome biogenesis GTPase Der [Patescibacteria group bacterium]
MMKKLPNVVIIGRINVGKSALFNRLTETTKAIVSDIPGTTRDYNISQVSWRGKSFNLIDTGGVDTEILKNSIRSLLNKKIDRRSGQIDQEIIKQTQRAMRQADVILMVVDGQNGLVNEDRELALVVKKFSKPTILVCNKIDSQRFEYQLNDFFKLGLGKPIMISAASGRGSGDFLDELVKLIKGKKGRPKIEENQRPIRVGLLGKPNVGKSSLVNNILGEERVIVSDTPQTTREPQDTEIEYRGRKIILVDTAGLRKKAKIQETLEKLSTQKTIQTIKQSDVVLFVNEADKTLTVQDLKLAGLVREYHNGTIIVANKWDLIGNKNEKSADQIKHYYRMAVPYLSFAPIIFVSAKTGQGVNKILDLVIKIADERQKDIDQKDLDEIIKKIVTRKRPVKGAGQNSPIIKSFVQVKKNPPIFLVTIGKDQTLHFSYVRFIENQLRKKFGFEGIPIKVEVRSQKR